MLECLLHPMMRGTNVSKTVVLLIWYICSQLLQVKMFDLQCQENCRILFCLILFISHYIGNEANVILHKKAVCFTWVSAREYAKDAAIYSDSLQTRFRHRLAVSPSTDGCVVFSQGGSSHYGHQTGGRVQPGRHTLRCTGPHGSQFGVIKLTRTKKNKTSQCMRAYLCLCACTCN